MLTNATIVLIYTDSVTAQTFSTLNNINITAGNNTVTFSDWLPNETQIKPLQLIINNQYYSNVYSSFSYLKITNISNDSVSFVNDFITFNTTLEIRTTAGTLISTLSGVNTTFGLQQITFPGFTPISGTSYILRWPGNQTVAIPYAYA